MCFTLNVSVAAYKSTNYLKLATAAPETHVFNLTLNFCNVYFLVPNIRYRPNIRQHFIAEYSFSSKTEKSVFGRSLMTIGGIKKIVFFLCLEWQT
jgi:hypothetical protein